MPPREEELTEAVREFLRAQGEAVREALRSVDLSYAIAEMADTPAVDGALEQTDVLLAGILVAHLPAWYAAGWDEAAEQLASAIDMLMRDEADARRRAREIVPVIQTTTRNALRDEAENAAAETDDRDEAMGLLLYGVDSRYEGWESHRAELIAVTESQSALGRGGMAVARIVAISQIVQKHNVDRGDDRVCMNCMANTGEGWIPLNQFYAASGTLTKPHHPRCRCGQQHRIR